MAASGAAFVGVRGRPPVADAIRKGQLTRVCGANMDIVHRSHGSTAGPAGTPLLPNGGHDRLDAFHVPFDPSTDRVVDVVVNAVAVIHNVDPVALEPLSNAIDPDALEEFVALPSAGVASEREVTFTYEGLEIDVRSDGHVWLEWLDGGA